MQPWPSERSWLPCCSMTPQPVLAVPGSMPRTISLVVPRSRMATPSDSRSACTVGEPTRRATALLSRDGLEDLLGDVEVGVDLLHVVAVFRARP